MTGEEKRQARMARLEQELAEAELALDASSRTLEPGAMRTQQTIAGLRGRVLGLRSEIVQIKMTRATGEPRAELRAEYRELQISIKEAELSARAASKQATEDELPELMRRLNATDELQTAIGGLH